MKFHPSKNTKANYTIEKPGKKGGKGNRMARCLTCNKFYNWHRQLYMVNNILVCPHCKTPEINV